MTGQLYTLRYRHGNAGVVTEFVEASSLQEATEIGEVYVNQLFNARFIKVAKAVVADASILALVGRSPAADRPAPDDEADGPMVRKVAEARVAPPVIPPAPIDPAAERAKDLADEEIDRQQLLQDEQDEARADARAKTRNAPPSLPALPKRK